MRHVFISPHMDDVVLSAGDHVLELRKQKRRVFIVTIFTKFGREPISLMSRRYLYDSGFFNLKRFVKTRKKEDKQAMGMLEVEYTLLGFIDGGFRQRKNVGQLFELLSYLGVGKKFFYPTKVKLFSGKISPDDRQLIGEISRRLKKLIKKDDVIYGPLAIDNHIDHLVTREVFSNFPNKKYYWLDQPYIDEKGSLSQLKKTQKNFKKAFVVEKNPQKRDLVNCYVSQVKCLFPGAIKLKKEVFYEEKN